MNFVQSSLKFFFFKNQYNLGWVSSFTQAYKGNNLFNNILYNIENVGYFDILNKNYQSSIQVNLFSSTALLKREMLEEFDMQFPNSCLEDGWLEFFATKKNWTGLVNPFVTSLESFDKNIKIMFKRNFRISDWGIKLVKEDLFRAQNEMKKTFYLGMFKSITSSFYQYFLSPTLLTLKIFILVNFWQTIFQHYEYIIIFSFLLISFFVSLFIRIAKNFPILGMKVFPFLFFNKILTTSMFWYSGIRFFNAFFRSKYATFETSRGNKTGKNNRFLIAFLFISLIIASFEPPFVLFKIYEKNLYLSFIFIWLNVIFGWMWISLFSFYFLYFLSFIKTNKKYNENDFIYCKNDYVQQKELIDKWCKQHNTFLLDIFK